MQLPSPITVVLAAAALIAAGGVAAQTVFRSVDSQGNVHFSDTPPPPGSGKQTETLTLPPLPTVPVRPDVEERLRSQRALPASGPRPSAQPRPRDTEIAAAGQAVAEAEQALAEAEIKHDEDWQRLASGRRVLSERYFDRVAGAEARLEAAQAELRRAAGRR